MKKLNWTVVLLYPDYMSNDGPEIFSDHTEAESAVEAAYKVQKDVSAYYETDQSDFLVLEVFPGHLWPQLDQDEFAAYSESQDA